MNYEMSILNIIKRVIKIMAGFVFFYSGFYYLIRIANRRKGNTPILMYHSINSRRATNGSPSSLYLYGMVVRKKIFEKHIKFLLRYYNIVSLRELVSSLKTKNIQLPKNALVITLDDGFKDNYVNAFPVLQKCQCKASMFIIGNAIDQCQLAWLHRLYNIVDRVQNHQIKIKVGTFLKNYSVQKNKISVLQELRAYLTTLPFTEKMNFLETTERLNNISTQTTNYYVTEKEIKTMMANGISFGAHSMRHLKLTSLNRDDAEREILGSKKVIEGITGDKNIPFAYPYGTIDSWNSSIVDLLKKHRLLCGLTTIEGLNNSQTDLFKMKRIEIGEFSKYELILHVSGVMGFFKKRGKKATKTKL